MLAMRASMQSTLIDKESRTCPGRCSHRRFCLVVVWSSMARRLFEIKIFCVFFQIWIDSVELTFGHGHRSKVIDQHDFDVDINSRGQDISSNANTPIVDQNVDGAKNLLDFCYFAGQTVQIWQVQRDYHRWMGWLLLEGNSLWNRLAHDLAWFSTHRMDFQ